MAELSFKQINGTTEFGCYGERGLMSYFMFVQLPKLLPEFLTSLRFPNGVESPFANLPTPITKSIIFSELDLGKTHGFGCPDGAIYLECPKPAMIFIEVKVNESYSGSNLIVRISDRNDGYNSTLKGQLELRWRFAELNRQRQTSSEQADEVIVETDEMYEQYKEDDWFYRRRTINGNLQARRHVKVIDGVKRFLDLLTRCEDRVYFLAITREQEDPNGGTTPFKDDSTSMPNTCGVEWNSVKHRFCWLPVGWLTQEQI